VRTRGRGLLYLLEIHDEPLHYTHLPPCSWIRIAILSFWWMNSGSHRTEGAGSHRHHWPIHGRDRECLAPRLDFIALVILISRKTRHPQRITSLTSPCCFRSFFLYSFPMST